MSSGQRNRRLGNEPVSSRPAVRAGRPPDDWPSISVVVPTYNRLESLALCLRALAELDYPRDRFEVVVVDDGSPVSVRPLVDELRGTLDVRVVVQSNVGPAAARNRGASVAEGEFLAFTDDDCRPDARWLKRLTSELLDAPDCIVGGRTINSLPENRFAEASQHLVDYLYADLNTGRGGPVFFTSNNMAVAADRFAFAGGFDERFRFAAGEDRALCEAWSGLGLPMRYAPTAVVYHRHDMSTAGFWRQHFHYGRGAFLLSRHRRAARPEGRVLRPPAFYARLLGYPLTRLRGRAAVVETCLFMISQLATAAGFAREALAWRRRSGG